MILRSLDASLEASGLAAHHFQTNELLDLEILRRRAELDRQCNLVDDASILSRETCLIQDDYCKTNDQQYLW